MKKLMFDARAAMSAWRLSLCCPYTLKAYVNHTDTSNMEMVSCAAFTQE